MTFTFISFIERLFRDFTYPILTLTVYKLLYYECVSREYQPTRHRNSEIFKYLFLCSKKLYQYVEKCYRAIDFALNRLLQI